VTYPISNDNYEFSNLPEYFIRDILHPEKAGASDEGIDKK
jgi:hypothetical protein